MAGFEIIVILILWYLDKVMTKRKLLQMLLWRCDEEKQDRSKQSG